MTHSFSTLVTGKSLQPSACDVSFQMQSPHLSTASSANQTATAWVDRQMNPHRAAAIVQHSGHSFLDVGCGNGRYVMHFDSNHRTAGIDIQRYPQWDEAPRQFQVADAASLPFEDGCFETIVSFEMLEHVPDPASVLQEFHRVCQKNIILSVPNCEMPLSLEASRLTFFHYTDRSHVNFFTRQLLAALLQQTGFEPQDLRLVNTCQTHPLLNDILRLPAFLTRLIATRVKKDALQMTILAVAGKK